MAGEAKVARVFVEVMREIDGLPEAVYAVIADYKAGHQTILPKEYFKDVRLLEGGKGAGTKYRVVLQGVGADRETTLTVREPDAGRVLIEEDKSAGLEIKYTVGGTLNPENCLVTIASYVPVRTGFSGWLEKLFAPAKLRKIFNEELARLAAVVER